MVDMDIIDSTIRNLSVPFMIFGYKTETYSEQLSKRGYIGKKGNNE